MSALKYLNNIYKKIKLIVIKFLNLLNLIISIHSFSLNRNDIS